MRHLLPTIILTIAITAGFCQQPIRQHDFSGATIVVAENQSPLVQVATTMLREEIQRRTTINLPTKAQWDASKAPVIIVGTFDSFKNSHASVKELMPESQANEAEGFTIKLVTQGQQPATALILGNDDRGTLYGVGYFLRKIAMAPSTILVPENVNVVTSPAVRLRGHQLGYRPKTNSYDGFDEAMWEQYIRDLVVFGTNAVELLPPFTDDASSSPMFPLPPMDMLLKMDALLGKYGLDAWIWYPLMHGDYTKQENVKKSLRENEDIFRRLPKVDAIFVPGGDPGHTPPAILFDYLEKQTAVLHKYHPQAEMWVSPQGFDKKWMDEFLQLVKKKPTWLTGIVYGPQVRIGLDELRREVPEQFLIRRYPDITHNYDAQYPVPNWDFAFAATANRESINPRPTQQKKIFNLTSRDRYHGFITYSEGVNDDVNKVVWSSLGWNPEADVLDVLHDYARYFIGPEYAGDFAQGILDLEENWNGPLITNSAAYTTLLKFQSMERAIPPRVMLNWRFQLALFRAYYDAYTRSRLLFETQLEDQAMNMLRKAPEVGTVEAMKEAESVLLRANSYPVAQDWKQRVFELAEALFQSIRMQKSVEKYYAAGVRRGANLDLINYPLNDRVWLQEQFRRIRDMESERERLTEIKKITQWENPGPGGFYDDLGDLSKQSHVVMHGDYQTDPAFLSAPFVGYTIGRETMGWRVSWARYVQTLYGQPLEMHYSNLDPSAQYEVKVTYTRDLYGGRKQVRMVADETIEVHPYLEKPMEVQPLTFDIPVEATRDGVLTLKWTSEVDMGGTGRGCQIAEVWLIKKREGQSRATDRD